MRKVLSFLIVFLGVGVLHAQNLLQNSDFTQLTAKQMPKFWMLNKVNGGERIILPDQSFALQMRGTQPQDDFFWIQHGVKMRAGENYTCRIKVKADSGTVVLVYAERSKPVFKTFSSGWKKGNGQWQELSFPICFERQGSLPYFVLRLKGRGTAQFTAPLVCVSEGIFRNGGFSRGLDGWQVTGDVGIADMGGNYGKTLELKSRKTGENPKAVYGNIRLQGGRTYLLSYHVKGTSDKKLADSMAAT